MKSFLLLIAATGCLCICGTAFSQNTVNYTSSESIIANPERGLQKYSISDNNYHTSSNYSNILSNTLSGWRTSNDKVTVIFRYFLLDKYLTSSISTTYLNNIQTDFDRIRSSGLKCIVRFSYSNAEGTSPQQPTKAIILQHLSQIAPILNVNKDIILTHQAGFIGTWGEWYYTNSTEFGTDGNINATQWKNRKEIVDAMLSATPQNIPLQVRYPEAKKMMYGTTALSQSSAYLNTPNARIGFFNDAFLNEWGDMGTYSVSTQLQNPVGTTDYVYLSNETKYVPMSGETNGLNPPRTDGANALSELGLTHWTTLNRDYFTQNFTNWLNTGHYADIVKNLGYRLVLKNSTFSSNGSSLSISISIENTGNARIFTPRKAWLQLKNTSSGSFYPFLLNTDPRTWESTITINQNIDLSSLPAGNYQAFLHLPDPDPALALRPEYSIQCANTNTWESSTGMNHLSQSFVSTVTGIEIERSQIHTVNISPNPASSTVLIYTPDMYADQIQILDGLGHLVKEMRPIDSSSTLPISDLSPGLYVLKIIFGNTTYTQMLAIQ